MLYRIHDGLFVPIFMLLLAMVSLQGGSTLAKSLFPLISAEGVTAYRLGISAIILFFVFKPWRIKFDRRAIHYLIFYGISLGSMNFFFYQSLKTLHLGIAVGIEFLGPLSVALASSRRATDFLWLLLVVIGLAMLLPIGDKGAGFDLVGAGYALLAGICWAIYIIFGQKSGQYYGTATVAIGSIIAALIFFPVGVIKMGVAMFNPLVIPAAFAVAILSSAIPYAFEMVALTRLPRKTFGTLTSLEPAVGALAGLLFLGEVLTLFQWSGIGAIILATMGATLTAKR